MAAEETTATAMEALDELRDVTSHAQALDLEWNCQTKMMALRDQVIAEANLPNKKLIDLSITLYGEVLVVYPHLLDHLRKTVPGQCDIERLARYLVKHIKHRALTGEYSFVNQERAKQLEEELQEADFSSACLKLEKKGG
jgi:hypothetical protein